MCSSDLATPSHSPGRRRLCRYVYTMRQRLVADAGFHVVRNAFVHSSLSHHQVPLYLYGPTLTSVHDYWKNHSLDYMDLVGKVMSLPQMSPNKWACDPQTSSGAERERWLGSRFPVSCPINSVIICGYFHTFPFSAVRLSFFLFIFWLHHMACRF